MFNPFEQPQATAAVMYGVTIQDENGDPVDPLKGVTNVNVLVGGMFSGLGDLEAWGQRRTRPELLRRRVQRRDQVGNDCLVRIRLAQPSYRAHDGQRY